MRPDGALVGLIDDAREDGLENAGVSPGMRGGREEGGGEVAEEGVDSDGLEEEEPDDRIGRWSGRPRHSRRRWWPRRPRS